MTKAFGKEIDMKEQFCPTCSSADVRGKLISHAIKVIIGNYTRASFAEDERHEWCHSNEVVESGLLVRPLLNLVKPL
jgi:hypothetical protein